VQATTGVAAAAGSAAGLVIAAPVAVVDQNTRENYGNEVESLTGPQSSKKASAGGKNCPPPTPPTKRCKT